MGSPPSRTGPVHTRLVPVTDSAAGAVPTSPRVAAAETGVDRWMPITIFGAPLTLHITGNLGAGHLLDGDPKRLDQTCLAMEALMLTALAHDPQIRGAAQKIRDAHPQYTDGQVMARLFPYLEFTATSVSIYRPIPEMRAVAPEEFEPHSWRPDDTLEIGSPGPRDFSSLGQQDALLCGYRAFLQHHAGGRAPGHTPPRDLIGVWENFQNQPGAEFPFDDRNALRILRRLFEDLRGASGREAGGEPALSVRPAEEEEEEGEAAITVEASRPEASITFAAGLPPPVSTVSFT